MLFHKYIHCHLYPVAAVHTFKLREAVVSWTLFYIEHCVGWLTLVCSMQVGDSNAYLHYWVLRVAFSGATACVAHVDGSDLYVQFMILSP